MSRKREGQGGDVGNVGQTALLMSAEAFWDAFGEVDWWCSSVLEADGKTRRTTGSFSVFAQDEGLKAAVRDRQNGKVAFVWAQTLFTLLSKVASGLKHGTLDWRPDKFAGS